MSSLSPWNKGLSKFNSKSVLKISKTFKRLHLDNFKNWREKAKLQGIIQNSEREFKKDENLAFLIGIALGDGNLSNLKRTQCLRITLGTDKPDLWKYTAKVIYSVFKKYPSVCKRKKSNCVNVTIYQKNISKRLRFPTGARINKKISIPKWILEDQKMLIQVIKGLYEAEASFSVHKKSYTYNLSFSNRNISLLNFVAKTLSKWRFHPERMSYAVRIRRKNEAYDLIKKISFRQYPLI